MEKDEFICITAETNNDWLDSQYYYNYEAMKSNEQKQWLKAMNEEIDAV